VPSRRLEKPTVNIHYEPLNTQSKSFFVLQLDHLRTNVEEIVNLNILPYGRTIIRNSTKVSFQCPDPNGTNETDCDTFKHHVSPN